MSRVFSDLIHVVLYMTEFFTYLLIIILLLFVYVLVGNAQRRGECGVAWGQSVLADEIYSATRDDGLASLRERR